MNEVLMFSVDLNKYFFYSMDLDCICQNCNKVFEYGEKITVVKRYNINYQFIRCVPFCINCQHMIKAYLNDSVCLAQVTNIVDDSMHLCDLDMGMRSVNKIDDLGLKGSTPKIVDNTVHSGRDSLEGAKIGLIDEKAIDRENKRLSGVSVADFQKVRGKVEKELDIDAWASDILNAKVAIDNDEKESIEYKREGDGHDGKN